jgi:hypothetical protein
MKQFNPPRTPPTAPPANKPSDASVQALFEEIDSEVKAEQLQNFIKQHGTLLLIGALMLVLVVAGFNTWQRMRAEDQRKDTSELISLMDRDVEKLTPDESKATFLGLEKMGSEGASGGHRALARLAEAGMLFRTGKESDAITVLKKLQDDNTVRPLYRDYALLQSVRARLGKADPQALITELQPILKTENPWRLSACETAAMLYAQKGDKPKALEFLKSIIDTPDTPLAAVERARSLSRLYSAP